MRQRVTLGVRLYRDGAAPLLVLSGGGGEAEAMRRLALAAGVPEPAVICEGRSRNTVENAVECARLLRQRGIGRIVLVSHRTHLPRARLLFRFADLVVAGSAGANARSPMRALAAGLYEAVALPRSLVRMLRQRTA